MHFDIVISSPLLRTTHTEYILTNYDDSIITDERLRKIVMKKDKGYKALFIENIDNKSERIKEKLKQESDGDSIKRLNKMLKR